ncbi:mitochondrial ribonuclease P protein 1 homolog [Chelonus insularis]|uniref:mitochondrial ribonuclease P protein 1 homolog n=1 Tax=Chelonus insularis TaxID=460826 RepID=UPI00158EE364|nr:mitochondrial ribonuclease P protein 1 homolog [Chelonus insularis]
MNTIRIVMLPVLRRVLSPSNNRTTKQFVQNSILVSQIINVPQRISCYYCTKSSTSLQSRIDKDLLAREKLEKYLENPENKKQYQMIQLEIEVMRQNGESVPSHIKDRQMLELTLLDSRSKRKRYLDFLFGIEKKKENRKMKIKEAELPQEQSNIPNYLQYKLGCNSPFLRYRETNINKLYNWNLMKAMMYGQKVIMDCGFEENMKRAEVKNCARQLMLAFATNRVHPNPLDITFCNINKNGLLYEELLSYIPTMNDSNFPLTVSEQSYLDLFDRDKLVYLTPDSNDTLERYDYDSIYIIGALVDKVSGRSDTLAKAKRERIRHAKLPIDKYLRFGAGARKSLTLNQMIAILADIQHTQDWTYAFRHIPKRKLYEYKLKDMENRIKEFCAENKYTSFSVYGKKEINEFDIKSRKKFRYKK